MAPDVFLADAGLAGFFETGLVLTDFFFAPVELLMFSFVIAMR